MSLKYVRSIRKLKIRLFTVWNVFLLLLLFGSQGRRHNTLYHSVFDGILVQLNEWIPVIVRLSTTRESRAFFQRSGKTLCVHV